MGHQAQPLSCRDGDCRAEASWGSRLAVPRLPTLLTGSLVWPCGWQVRSGQSLDIAFLCHLAIPPSLPGHQSSNERLDCKC